MSISKTVIITIFTSIMLLAPLIANSATYPVPVGTLVKSQTKSEIFFIATDGKKYHIPDPTTFLSWYPDFSHVEILSDKDLRRYKSGNFLVTARPGTSLVKFKNSPKIYAVDSGATLRWITNETLAYKLYGLNWQIKIIELEDERLSTYILGEDIKNTGDFNRTIARMSSNSIDDEIKRKERISISSTRNKNKPATIPMASLRTIGENMRANLTPAFSPFVRTYSINAKPTENVFKIAPVAYDNNSVISVNGTKINSGQTIAVNITTGKNDIIIKSSASDGSDIEYSLVVYKRPASENANLKSLYVNLNSCMDPIFDPFEYEYSINANYENEYITIRGSVGDKNAKISVNDYDVKSGSNIKFLLNFGENIFNIKVTAENGQYNIYTLKVYRAKWEKTGDTDIIALHENLIDDLDQEFDPNQTIYYIRASKEENSINLSVRAKRKEARVFINDVETKKTQIGLDSGENEIIIRVEFANKFSKEYKLNVYRQE